MSGLPGRPPGCVPRRGRPGGGARRGSRRRGRALAARGCLMRAIRGRPSWRRCRGKPRGSPGCHGTLPTGYRPRGRCRRRRGPGRPAGAGCTTALRRAGTSRLATVTRYGHLPGTPGRRRIRTRRVGVACATVRVSAARPGPAAQPSSKASHIITRDPLRTPTPCSCRQPAAAVPGLPAKLEPSDGMLWRGKPSQLTSRGLRSRAVMVACRGPGRGHCWLNSYRRHAAMPPGKARVYRLSATVEN
jgi:hypothetical protein